ncbi:hypothetical protein HNQ50_003340 [Silvimonas terrae]|uniref:Uncharacterized protein n=1 Tax=Silvimonas terrae TaxID=300266 RepID=A0A840RJW8_9NEIS|nr:hypothetical protein [Silvimonas terrae]
MPVWVLLQNLETLLAPCGAVFWMSGVARQQGTFFWVASLGGPKKSNQKKGDPGDSARFADSLRFSQGAAGSRELGLWPQTPLRRNPAPFCDARRCRRGGTSKATSTSKATQPRKPSARKNVSLRPPPRHSRGGGNPVRSPAGCLRWIILTTPNFPRRACLHRSRIPAQGRNDEALACRQK